MAFLALEAGVYELPEASGPCAPLSVIDAELPSSTGFVPS